MFLQPEDGGTGFRVRRWIADQMPNGAVDRSSPLVVVSGVKQIEDIIVKLTLNWLVKLYHAGQTLEPFSCNILPLLSRLLDILTSETIDEPLREGLRTISSRRGVIMNLAFFVDYLVECFEFNFGTEVFAFMEYVAARESCANASFPHHHRATTYKDCLEHLIEDIFLSHIFLSSRPLDDVIEDLGHVGLMMVQCPERDSESSKCIKELLAWTELECVASRRTKRYYVQRVFTRFMWYLESGIIDAGESSIVHLSANILSHKDIFRRAMLKRLLSILTESRSIDEKQKEMVRNTYHMISLKD